MIRSDIRAAIRDFEKLADEMQEKAETAISKSLLDVQADFMRASPVDSGIFRSSWDIDTNIMGTDAVEGSVYNPVIYAEVLEMGSAKGEKPWPSAGRLSRIRTASGRRRLTVRTVESNGRIWSSQAPGGVMGPVLDDGYLDSIFENIHSAIFSDLGN